MSDRWHEDLPVSTYADEDLSSTEERENETACERENARIHERYARAVRANREAGGSSDALAAAAVCTAVAVTGLALLALFALARWACCS